MSSIDHTESLRTLCNFFETLTLETAQHADHIYARNAYFKDPFNEVHDNQSIKRLFVHMFEQVDNPRFVIHESILQGNQAFITWDMICGFKSWAKGEQRIRGGTHLTFAEDGLVASHRDYWDAAEELYEKLPVLGSFMRLLKKAAG
jgi:hypothetical protein